MTGRPEAHLNPDHGPIEAFAVDLRALRHRAGQPSYRALAKTAHYSAATLAQATAGRRLPSLEVTLALVGACGGDRQEWTHRWQQTKTATDGDRSTPTTSPAPHPLATDSTAADSHPAAHRQHLRSPPISSPKRLGWILAASAAVTAAGAGGWGVGHAPTAAGHPGAANTTQLAIGDAVRAVSDGADPIQAGCDRDAVTLDSRLLRDNAGGALGDLSLRYSPRCAASWARFHADSDFSATPPLVTVTIERPADGALSQFRYRYDGRNVYTDLLLTPSCTQASTTIKISDHPPVTATTACQRSPVGEQPGPATSALSH